MRPSVREPATGSTEVRRPSPEYARRYVIVAAMMLFSPLAYSGVGTRLGDGVTLLVNTAVFFLCMYVYYGIAILAYHKRTYLLLGAALAAVIVTCLAVSQVSLRVLLTGWGMLLLAGIASGRMTRSGFPATFAYGAGAVAVIALFAAQSWPMWSEFLNSAPEFSQTVGEQTRQFLIGLGYSNSAVEENVHQMLRFFDLMLHFFPSLSIMAALLQFSVGYLAFVNRVSRCDPSRHCVVPFTLWKVPFGLTPVLLAIVLVRLLSPEQLRMMADNALLILAVYYSIAGLALVEYFLKRLRVSRLMKAFVYLLLFLTQLVGFLAVALVGFADSFADWRKRSLAEAA